MIRSTLLVFLSIVGGLLAAATFVVTIGPDGGFTTLTLPAVAEIAFSFGGIAGLLISPLVVWALKDRNLLLCVPIVYGVACIVIVVLNVLSVRFSEIASFAVTAVLLLLFGLVAKR